ncbi:MAG TPA: branched-chain amino acid ABC transporter permease [Anaerolineales bacterium]|nr:branched-chain amino acid ABC transporter permease [Anaerolineales bacterium]
MSTLRKPSVFVPAVLFALLLALPGVASEYVIHLSVLVLMYAYLATAWNILGGYAGQHSLGHSLFLGVGAYTSTFLFVQMGVTPWLGMWLGAILAGVVGWFVGYLCFRYGIKGPYFALVTIALAEAAVYITSNASFIGGARGLEVTWLGSRPDLMQFNSKSGYYYIILVMTALAIILTKWCSQRGFGFRLVAVRENEDAAEALGVNTLRTKIQASVLSAALTALGGSFFAQYFTYIGPKNVFGEVPSVQILLFAIIGGLGTVWGPALGALILVPVAELARGWLGGSFSGAHLLLYGTVLVVVMLFMPKGIIGLLGRIRLRPVRRRQARVEDDVT